MHEQGFPFLLVLNMTTDIVYLGNRAAANPSNEESVNNQSWVPADRVSKVNYSPVSDKTDRFNRAYDQTDTFEHVAKFVGPFLVYMYPHCKY